MGSETIFDILVRDNLDTACQAIEKAAMDRAILDFDENFGGASDIRRLHREVRWLVVVFVCVPYLYMRVATSGSAVLGSYDSSYPLHPISS